LLLKVMGQYYGKIKRRCHYEAIVIDEPRNQDETFPCTSTKRPNEDVPSHAQNKKKKGEESSEMVLKRELQGVTEKYNDLTETHESMQCVFSALVCSEAKYKRDIHDALEIGLKSKIMDIEYEEYGVLPEDLELTPEQRHYIITQYLCNHDFFPYLTIQENGEAIRKLNARDPMYIRLSKDFSEVIVEAVVKTKEQLLEHNPSSLYPVRYLLNGYGRRLDASELCKCYENKVNSLWGELCRERYDNNKLHREISSMHSEGNKTSVKNFLSSDRHKKKRISKTAKKGVNNATGIAHPALLSQDE